MWTRWRCRRCYHDILAGLRGKYRQAIAGRTGEWSAVSLTSSREEERKSKSLEAGNNELRARLEDLEERRRRSPRRARPSFQEGGVEEEWGMDMDVEEEVESCKKLDEQKKEVAGGVARNLKFSCLSKEVQESPESNLLRQLQEVEQRRHDLMSEHQKVQKISQNMQSIQDKRRKNEKKVLQHKRRCGRSERKLTATRSDFGSRRTKSIGTEWSMQKWQHNFRDCRQEKKEEAAMLRKRWIVAWRRGWNRSSLWEQIRRGLSSMLCARCSSRNSRCIPLLRRWQEKEEEEGIVRTNRSKAKPVRRV